MNVFCWLGWNAPTTRERAARDLEPVREPRPARRELDARERGRAQRRPRRLVPERAEHDDHAHLGRAAAARARGTAGTCRARSGVGLFAGGAQRTAAAMYASCSSSPSSSADRLGLIREAGAVQRREQEVARAVAGEHPAGAVAAVRGGREPDDAATGPAGSPKPGHRSAPVLLVAERGPLLARDLLPPRDQPRARPARDDLAS